MNHIPIGVANSISLNFDFDPIDTIQFATQSRFEIIQIYLSRALLDQPRKLSSILANETLFKKVYYHAEGLLNEEFIESEYQSKLFDFLQKVNQPNFIIHFDERMDIDRLVNTLEGKLSSVEVTIYLENYFQERGKTAAEKNLKKFLALFTLLNLSQIHLRPVFDIPRIFHQTLDFTISEGVQWCYQIFNYFGNRQLPVLLHLIDTASREQRRRDFIALGQGVIPYNKILPFILKTRPKIEGIILEFEDKLNALQSRDYLAAAF